jgi:hypothetical protein
MVKIKRIGFYNIIVVLVFLSILIVFFINQNIYLQKQIVDIQNDKKNDLLVKERFKLNQDYTLNNNLSNFENTKNWTQYSNQRIPLVNFRDQDENTTPLMKIR